MRIATTLLIPAALIISASCSSSTSSAPKPAAAPARPPPRQPRGAVPHQQAHPPLVVVALGQPQERPPQERQPLPVAAERLHRRSRSNSEPPAPTRSPPRVPCTSRK